MTTVQIAAYLPRSRVNGPGVRAVLWVQGCPMRCVGCFNPDFQPFEGGEARAVAEVVDWIVKDDATEGVTFSGGEPFAQAAALTEVARGVQQARKSVVVFTGYECGDEKLEGQKWEMGETQCETPNAQRPTPNVQLSTLNAQCLCEEVDARRALIAQCDALIAGPYRQEVPSRHPLLGSGNQRIVLLTDRYRIEDFQARTGRRAEYRIAPDGRVTVTGFPRVEAKEQVTK